MPTFTNIPEKFASVTQYNPKMVLVHLDQMKTVMQEMQEFLAALTARIDAVEKSMVTVAKTKAPKDKE